MARNVYTPSPEFEEHSIDARVPDFSDSEVLADLGPEHVMDIARWSHGALLAQIERTKQAFNDARIDPTTGIRNKLAYNETLARLDATMRRHDQDERRTGEGPSLHMTAAFIDLDNFGQINKDKKYGHAVGDTILVDIAQALASVLRPGDEIFRRGGDEFVIIFAGEPREGGLDTIKQRLKAAALEIADRDPVLRDRIGLGASVAIGRSQDGEYPEEFINRLDQNLDEEKQKKKITHKK